MGKHLIHITGPNERWDHIAYQYYGQGTLIEPLLKANPQLVSMRPAPLVLPARTNVRVPVLEQEQVKTVSLPPWKRGADE